MNDSLWDAKLKTFLNKTGEDFKRAGNDIKTEAEKLMKEVKDPDRQAKLKAGMKDLGGWARKTAEEMATLMETGVKKAEGVLNKATDKVVDFATPQKTSAAGAADSADIPDPSPTPANPVEPPPAKAKPAKKSIGGAKRKASSKKGPAAKKSIGKTPPAGDE
jgi:hypothetical protein